MTILRDLSDSVRVSYVGVSNYQMGEQYGGWLLSLMNNGTSRVCLLQDSGDSENEIQLLFTQTVQAVRNGSSDDEKMELVTRSVDSTVDFDAEEVIRDILLDENRPDILICRNSVQTECAIQALVDYNLVGKVQVIGYYLTDTIQAALRQDLIPVTMMIDTKALGQDCAQALGEYLDMDTEGKPHLYVPDVYFIKDGQVVDRHEGVTPGLDSPSDALTEDMKKDLMAVLKEGFDSCK